MEYKFKNLNMEEKASKKDSDAMDVSSPNSQNNDQKCSPLVYFFKRTRLYAFPKLFTTDILFLKVSTPHHFKLVNTPQNI